MKKASDLNPQTLLIKTKLNPPVHDLKSISRAEVQKMLETSLRKKLTIVHAPAGYGKTTALIGLHQKLNSDILNVCWLSVDKNDDTFFQFFSYVAASLQTAVPESLQLTTKLISAGASHSEDMVISSLINELAEIKKTIILILDDYHSISSPLIHESMDRLLLYLPENIHIVIGVRSETPLQISDLRASGQLCEVNIHNLQFSMEETTSFLNDLHGLSLEHKDVQKLHEKCEGWVVGLQLASISLTGEEKKVEIIEEISGSQKTINEYLVHNVLRNLPEPIAGFLLKTSILDRMTPDLCYKVTGISNSVEILEDIEKKNLFLQVLDEKRKWYRYHHLFGDLLRKRLEIEMPEEINKLHAAATEWFAGQGLAVESVQHALSSGNNKRAAELIEEKLEPIYGYLDKLDKQDNRNKGLPGGKELSEYLTDIITNILEGVNTLDIDDINLFMHFFTHDLMDMQIEEDGKIDFADIDDLIKKFSDASPEGLTQIIESLNPLFYDDEFKKSVAGLLNNFGTFLGKDETYLKIKTFLDNLYEHYNSNSFGELLDRLWDEGPEIGPIVEKAGTPFYGKNGEQRFGLRELLMQPDISCAILEALHQFKSNGFDHDRFDEQLQKMALTDPLFSDLKGKNHHGDGNFYEPTEDFSFKNFSALKGLISLLNRLNVPFTLTSPIIWCGENAEKTLDLVRALMPKADSISLGNILWAEIYEKDENEYLGHGTPVTSLKGHGMLKNGRFVAPGCPTKTATSSIAIHMVCDSIVNGPYDNIYDNINWVMFERDIYAVLELVELFSYMPSINFLTTPVFKTLGIEKLPVTIAKLEGLNEVIFLEIGELVKNLPARISNELLHAQMPEWITKRISDILINILNLGNPNDDSVKTYLFPKDVRNLCQLIFSLGYYDPGAFKMDKFYDLENPDNYMKQYDISEYRFEKQYDKTNPFTPTFGALIVSQYLLYDKKIGNIRVPIREGQTIAQIAIKEFGIDDPLSYLINVAGTLAENITESDIYHQPDSEATPLISFMEPFAKMKSTGVIDSLLEFLCVLGKPSLKDAREKLFSGISELIETIEKGSTSPYTLSSEFLKIPERALKEPKRWDAFKHTLNVSDTLLSSKSPFQIIDDVLRLTENLCAVDLQGKKWRLVSEGIVDVVRKSTEQKLITRSLIHASTILDEFNNVHIWEDTIRVMNEAFKKDGVLSYVMEGMERDPSVSWEEILFDSDKFLHSDLMLQYEEGSFWKDIYYLLYFMSNSIN